MKPVVALSLVLSIVSALIAGGAYWRMRSAPLGGGGGDAEALKTRIQALEKDLVQANDRVARLERQPRADGDGHDHGSGDGGEVVELRRRIENLERQLGPGRTAPEGRPMRPNPGLVDTMKKRFLDTAQSERSRVGALGILRSQAGNKTDDVIDGAITLFNQSKEPTMRAAIARHLQGAESPKVQAFLLPILKGDPDEDTRDEAARTLGEYLSDPQVKSAIEQAAANDVSEKVKRRAQAALAGPPKTK